MAVKIFLFMVVVGFPLFGQSIGFDAGWQSRWKEGNLFSVGIALPRMGKGYIITGFNFQLAKKEHIPTIADLSGDISTKSHSYYGAYTGYHFFISPLFRPGIVFGIGWDNDEKFVQDTKIGYTGYEISPYFGFDVHVYFFSFKVSNEGIGLGVNYAF